MTLNYKKITLIFVSSLLALALSGCSCKHDWQDGTCQSPRICVLCGKTEGKVRAHKYVNTACHEPQGCVYCGTLEGIEYSHQWRDNCKICIYCGYDGRPADERFPDLLSAGLEERWALEAQLPAEPSAEDWEAIFNAEYERLAVFKEDKLQDEQLQSAVLRYIKSLEASLAALEYFGTELWTDKYHNGAYWEQTNALFLLNQQSPVSVSEQYSEKLSDMLHNGEIINMVRPLLSQVKFLNVDKNKYETTLENTTSLTFEWFSLDVNLFDKSGNITDSKNCKVENWEPGEKLRFNFNTDKELSAIEVAFANWQLAR